MRMVYSSQFPTPTHPHYENSIALHHINFLINMVELNLSACGGYWATNSSENTLLYLLLVKLSLFFFLKYARSVSLY